MNKKNKVSILLISFFILLSAGFMSYYFYVLKEQPTRLAILGNPGHKVGPFSFTDQEGRTITEETVEGKIRVIEYFFTTCKGICPKMNENMSKVYQSFLGNNDVIFLSHTVDPKKDTVAAMKAYSLRFDANPDQWYFLTGSKQDLYDMARQDYLITAADTAVVNIESDFIHTQYFVLVDKHNRIRGKFYDGTEPTEVNQLITDIKLLIEEEKDENK